MHLKSSPQKMNFRWVLYFCIIILCFKISACGLGFEEDKEDDESLKESNKILNEYEKVKGEYEGILNLTVGKEKINPVKIRILLRPNVTYSGRSDGELVPQVSMEGSFEVLDFIWTPTTVVYEGRYWYAQDGLIDMVGKDSEMGFKAYRYGNKLVNGRIRNELGDLGDFEAELVSKEVKAPGEGQDEERRKRLEESYKDLIGSYIGRVNNPTDSEKHRRDLQLRFRFFLAGSKLRATVDKPYTDNDRVRPLEVVTFRPDTGLIELKGRAMSTGVGTVPGYGEFNAVGYLRGDTIVFEQVSDHLGTLGTFEGKKVIDQPESDKE